MQELEGQRMAGWGTETQHRHLIVPPGHRCPPGTAGRLSPPAFPRHFQGIGVAFTIFRPEKLGSVCSGGGQKSPGAAETR